MNGRILTARDLTADVDLSCDVCIIGSGAGGAVLADGLVERGLKVVMLEEGGYHTRRDFDLQEGHAFPMLYQDRGTRATADQAITILQGRTVGGTTVINWTTCFRTPPRILEHWSSVHGLEGLSAADLEPHFEAVEARLSVQEWPLASINANNRVLLEGCQKLGWEAKPLRRNVKGCANSGFCGLGCPIDAKQSMLVTYLPDAVEKGLELYADTRAERLEVAGGRVTAVHASVMVPDTTQVSGRKVVVRPKVAVSSGGAINSPALLLRSGLDRNGRVGRRTFLHPVVSVVGIYDQVVNAFYGAPQSIGSHQFIDRGPDRIGFFLETPPLQPMLAATAFPAFGRNHHELMSLLPHVGGLLALTVDGLLPGDEGGVVSLREDGRVRVDYEIKPHHAEAFREATRVLARIALAAGAKQVYSLHLEPIELRSEADLSKLEQARYGALEHAIFTAHQMGGCVMGRDPATSVVDSQLRHHEIPNLFVVDGSVFPTALGVNPSESIYGIAHRARDHVASAV